MFTSLASLSNFFRACPGRACGAGGTYRTQQHLHVDPRRRVDAVQLARAVAVDDVDQRVDSGFDVSEA